MQQVWWFGGLVNNFGPRHPNALHSIKLGRPARHGFATQQGQQGEKMGKLMCSIVQNDHGVDVFKFCPFFGASCSARE